MIFACEAMARAKRGKRQEGRFATIAQARVLLDIISNCLLHALPRAFSNCVCSTRGSKVLAASTTKYLG
jgi:hypothetical protein